MARPIRETPILYGKDAERFVQEMARVENLSNEVRANNRARLEEDYAQALRHITLCI